jgi:hypothetical protein
MNQTQPPQQPGGTGTPARHPAPSPQQAPQQPRPVQAIPAQPRPAAPAQPMHSTHGGGGAKIAGMPTQAAPRADDHSLDPISLVDDYDGTSDKPTPSKIKAFGVAGMHATHTYKRQTYATGQGACRVRSFHGRLSDEGMAYMDDKINEWLDAHPDIEVKIVTTSIGQYEGKIKEPALVLNVWY